MRRLYTIFLAFYPEAFRQRFGDELTLAFTEGLRAARRKGIAAAAVFACTRLLDAVQSGMAERWQRRRDSAHDRTPAVATEKGWPLMRLRFAQDSRLALRLIARQPGFALIVVLTLAIGIGANTAVFSLVDGILLRSLPYRDPARLGFLWTKLDWIGVPRAWISGGHIAILQREMTSFDSLVALRTGETQLTGAGDPAQIRVATTTTNVFDTLGVRPSIGRGFRSGEDRKGASSVVVLSHALWRERFGSDTGILGTRISLGGERYEVIGVMPPDFRFVVTSSLGGPVTPDAWIPGTWDFATMPTSPFSFALMARVKPAVTVPQARAELDALGARLDREVYKSHGFGWRFVGVQEDLTSSLRPALLILLAAAGLVLLIACANVASLFLVRAVGRERELALRTALGAGRGRIAFQLVIESLALTGLGTLLAVALAYVSIATLKATIRIPIPRLDEVAVDWRVLVVASGVALLTAVVFGALPVFHLRRWTVAGSLKEGTRSSGAARTQRLRSLFVIGEMAMALLLVVAAVLFIRTFAAMRAADPGFNPAGVLTTRLTLPVSRYPDGKGATEFVALVLERLAVLPGVHAVGATNAAPLSRRGNQYNAQAVGLPDAPRVLVDGIVATPGYFRAAGMTLIRGRDFTPQDRADGQKIALIDDVFARIGWPNTDPIRQTMRMDTVDVPITVIGVVRQAHLYHFHLNDRPQVYVPHTQWPVLGITLVARVDGDPAALAPLVRRTVTDLDPTQPIADTCTMTQVVDDHLADRRLSAMLLSTFGAVAMLLAAVGLYGLMAYAVSQRTQELGIRMALGARPGDVQRMVLGRGTHLAAIGLTIGGAAAWFMSGFLKTQLYGVSPTDAVTFAAVAGGLFVIALVASYVPARRAARVDPALALKRE